MLYLILFCVVMQLGIVCLIYALLHEQARKSMIWLEYVRDRECVRIARNGNISKSFLSEKNKTHYIERLERI